MTAHSTTYEVRFGGGNLAVAKRFGTYDYNDAVVRFAEAIVRLDSNPEVTCAWASLTQRDKQFGTSLASWTKTSNERPTAQGEDII